MPISNSSFRKYCIEVFSKLRPSATFLSIKGYRNNYSEVSDFGICFHIDYINAVRRSNEILKAFSPNFKYCFGTEFSLYDLEAAKEELLRSFSVTLNGKPNPWYTCHDVYEKIYDVDGKVVPGCKLHIDPNVLHIEGRKIYSKVKIPGKYPNVKSSGKTIAKRSLRRETPLGDWVQFQLTPYRFDELVVEKNIIRGRI